MNCRQIHHRWIHSWLQTMHAQISKTGIEALNQTLRQLFMSKNGTFTPLKAFTIYITRSPATCTHCHSRLRGCAGGGALPELLIAWQIGCASVYVGT